MTRASRVAVLALLAASCGAGQRAEPATSAPSTAATAVMVATPEAAPTATPRPLPHVFVIVMENAGLARALRSRPIGALASHYALATGYHAVARPSLPNYLAMTAGSTFGIADNDFHALPRGGIGAQLTDASITWRAYMEGMTAGGGCLNSPYPYALKHNPFAYLGGCGANVVPFETLDRELGANTPSFIWITPGLCNDGHDCPIDEAGAWLDALVAKIVGSKAWSERGALFIVWDEGDGGDDNLVPLILTTSRGLSGEIRGSYDHYSLLATLEDLFHLPRLGAATTAVSLAPIVGGD